MNLKLVSYNLGIITLLIACAMVFGMLWAFPCFGGVWANEARGVYGLSLAILFTGTLSGLFFYFGKTSRKQIVFRREAIVIVGVGWILATLCSALPYYISRTPRLILEDGTRISMSAADSFFESASGLTTTGATVFSELENPAIMPRTILFWRSMTHFIGGVGIVVLLVALLDTGMAGKLLVQREITGPKTMQTYSRTQLIMRRTLSVYLSLNFLLFLLLLACGLSFFDAICHAFGTIATGGMGTYNDSFRHFRSVATVHYAAAEWIMGIFMFLAGMNLISLYYFAVRQWASLLKNREWQIYVALVFAAAFGVFFLQNHASGAPETALRDSFFQTASIITTTGYATCDYTFWTPAAQTILILLMLVTSCSGSTAGGVKVVRYILLFKFLHLEIEKVYRPQIVRPLTYNGERLTDPSIANGVFLYLAMAALSVLFVWVTLMFIEPDTLWLGQPQLVEAKGADLLVTTLSHYANVGPGIGVFGPMNNFGLMTDASKYLLSSLMILGRLDFFAVLLLFSPSFWKN